MRPKGSPPHPRYRTSSRRHSCASGREDSGERTGDLPEPVTDDPEDITLRPATLDAFVGQEPAKNALRIAIAAARQRGEPIDHILFAGPPGLGKTTLAHIIAREMGAAIRATTGPVLEKPGDTAGSLTALKRGDVLFIDEIHRMNPVVEEILYPAMEDFFIDVMIGEGPSARSIKLTLEHFTLIGATTRQGLLSSPFRDRFGIIVRLNLYSPEDLVRIVTRSAGDLKNPDHAGRGGRDRRPEPGHASNR